MNSSPLPLDSEQINREASALLSVRGNRMRMILASLIVLSTVVFYAMLSSAFDYAIARLFGMLTSDHQGFLLIKYCYFLFIVLTMIYFTVPLALGLLHMAYLISEERETVLSDLFHFFSSRHAYKRASDLSFWLLVRIAPAYVLMELIYAWSIHVTNGSYWGIALAGVMILCEIVLLLFTFFGRFYSAYLLCVEHSMEPHVARFVAKRMTKHYGFRVGLCHFSGSLPDILLSVVTMGIYFFVDALPKMLISYFCICRKSISLIIQTEE